MLAEISGQAATTPRAAARGGPRRRIHAGIVAARTTGDGAGALNADVREALEQVSRSRHAHSLGIEIKQKDNARVKDVLIAKNTQLPTAASRV